MSRRDDRRSPEAKSWQRWYRSKRWEKLRARQLDAHPMCQCPHCQGRELLAVVVDHSTPHKGDRKLFWDAANLRSMAKSCHDRWKQSEERGGRGFMAGCDASGEPLHPGHHWHR